MKIINLWSILISLSLAQIFNRRERKIVLNKLRNEVNKSWEEYDRIPDHEKDRMRINLAQDMGCTKKDLKSCKEYLRNYARSS